MRILLAEDEHYARKALIGQLERFDPSLSIAEAKDGDEANALLSLERFNLLLCDIRMPVVDGLHVSRGALEAGRADHVVLLTGYAEFSYALEALRIGVRDLLLKPVETDKLYSILESIRETQSPKIGDAIVDSLNTYIRHNLSDKLSIADICRNHLFLSPAYVSRHYRRVTGETIIAVVQRLRMEKAMSLLVKTQLSVSGISERCGYGDASVFIGTFKKAYGMTPLEFRTRQKGK